MRLFEWTMLKRDGIGQAEKPINNANVPRHKIEAVARCILPDILTGYESEAGQKEFARWKAQPEAEQGRKDKKNKIG